MAKMIKTANIYNYVNGLTPVKTPHNLSYQTTTTMDMGYFYPNFYKMCIPGDKINLANENVVIMNPQLAPLMHEIKVTTRWFFVPLRLLWRGDKWYNEFEVYITGSIEGTEISKWNKENPDQQVTYPDITERAWNPMNHTDKDGVKIIEQNTPKGAEIGTIWDAIGLPSYKQIKQKPPATNCPNDFIKRAYNKIYNDWIRDENLMRPVSLDNDDVLKALWPRDYYTSASYEQQKGTAPQVGVSVLKHEFVGNMHMSNHSNIEDIVPTNWEIDNDNPKIWRNPTQNRNGADTIARWQSTTANPPVTIKPEGIDDQIHLRDHESLKFNVADMRYLFAIQKALELDMRAGTRYIEFIKANFNASPRDERLQMAEYIGMEEQQIMSNEVFTTAESTDGKTGQMAGKAMSMRKGVNQTHNYYAQEHGVIIGTITIEPKAQYQQGIPRELMYKDKLEYYRPQFAYLSEQEIRNSEIYYNGIEAEDKEIFGYQGRYDEMRIDSNRVMGLMRADVDENLSYWNLARIFGNRPKLNEEFITMNVRKDFLQVPTQPACIITCGWHCYMERPIPATSDPGNIDQVYGEHSTHNKVPRQGRRL